MQKLWKVWQEIGEGEHPLYRNLDKGMLGQSEHSSFIPYSSSNIIRQDWQEVPFFHRMDRQILPILDVQAE
jgi:hypothetical protein